MTSANSRTSDLPVDPLFLDRWSPRAFDNQPLSDEEVMTLLEAARWAPSSYNSQPARLLYAKRGTPHWDKFLDLLVPFNRAWAERAGLMIVVVSNSLMVPPGQDKPVPSHSHSFDAGAAWMSLALQATRMGLQAHAMVGFDMDRAFAELNVPQGHRVEAAVAVGRPGDKAVLPDALREREQPNGREPLAKIALEGGFPAAA